MSRKSIVKNKNQLIDVLGENSNKNEFTKGNMTSSLTGVPFSNKKVAEFLTKEWLKSNPELKYFLEKDKFSCVFKCKKNEDLYFHIIVKQLEEIEKPEKIETDEDIKLAIQCEKCTLSVFIFKGKENEFKNYAYSLLESLVNYAEEKR